MAGGGFVQDFLNSAVGGYKTGQELQQQAARTDYLRQAAQGQQIQNQEAALPGQRRALDQGIYADWKARRGGAGAGAIPAPNGIAGPVVTGNDPAASSALPTGPSMTGAPQAGGMGTPPAAAGGGQPSNWDKMLGSFKSLFGMDQPGGGMEQSGIPYPGQVHPAEPNMQRTMSGQDLLTPEQLDQAVPALLPDKQPGEKLTADDWGDLAEMTYQRYLEGGQGMQAAEEARGRVLQSLQSITVRTLADAAQDMVTGNPQGAAKKIEEYHRFTPDGLEAQVGVNPDGSLSVQMLDEKTGQPSGPPQNMDASAVEAIIPRLTDPMGWQDHLQTVRKTDADIAHSEALTSQGWAGVALEGKKTDAYIANQQADQTLAEHADVRAEHEQTRLDKAAGTAEEVARQQIEASKAAVANDAAQRAEDIRNHDLQAGKGPSAEQRIARDKAIGEARGGLYPEDVLANPVAGSMADSIAGDLFDKGHGIPNAGRVAGQAAQLLIQDPGKMQGNPQVGWSVQLESGLQVPINQVVASQVYSSKALAQRDAQAQQRAAAPAYTGGTPAAGAGTQGTQATQATGAIPTPPSKVPIGGPSAKKPATRSRDLTEPVPLVPRQGLKPLRPAGG